MLIHYYGHVGQSTGYGRAATDLCKALHRAGVEMQIRPLCPPDQVDYAMVKGEIYNSLTYEMKGEPSAIIVHTLPGDCRKVYDIAQLERYKGVAPIVAYTTWEALSDPPEHMLERYVVFDQVWVPSQQSSFEWPRHHGMWPWAQVVPHCFDELTWAARGTDPVPPPYETRPFDGYTFLYVGAWTPRKNPTGLVLAFLSEFSAKDNVRLRLHCRKVLGSELARIVAATGIDPQDIPRIETYPVMEYSEADLWAFHRAADCFVSASHGEAWNLPAFDSYLAGRQCIVPQGQGSETYLQGTDAARVRTWAGIPWHSVQDGQKPGEYIVQGAQGLTSRMRWEDVSLHALAHTMRQHYSHRARDLCDGNGLSVRADTSPLNPRLRFGYEPVAKLVLQHLGLS